MPRARVALALTDDQWIPTDGGGAVYTPAGREVWLTQTKRRIASTMGLAEAPREVAAALEGLEPSAGNVDRYLFVPLRPAPLALVMVTCTEVTPTWKSDVVDAASHPVGLVRDTEIRPLEVPFSDEGISAIRCEEQTGRVLGTLICAVPRDGHLVMLRGVSRDMLTIVALREAATQALAGSELVPAAPSV